MRRPVAHSLVKALRAVPGFDALDDRLLLQIVGASANFFWPEGATVFEKGSPGEALYVVLSGCVRIFDEVDGREIEIATTQKGDFFGEMSLLLDTTHTKNAVAAQDTELLVLMSDAFRRLLESNKELAGHIHKTLEARRSETEAKYQTEEAS